MFPRLIAFFFLVLHINGSMLLPQVQEQDVYANGQQVDDVNCLVEYIAQEVLDLPDDTPEDEDDDRGQDFQLIRFGDEFCEQNFRFLQIAPPVKESTVYFFDNRSARAILISFDILTPPPKA
jgi:hypothetical protein